MPRITRSMVQVAADALTDHLHKDGLLHPEARFVVHGMYEHTYVSITGGPHYGTGMSHLAIGTPRECIDIVRAYARVKHLSESSTLTYREQASAS